MNCWNWRVNIRLGSIVVFLLCTHAWHKVAAQQSDSLATDSVSVATRQSTDTVPVAKKRFVDLLDTIHIMARNARTQNEKKYANDLIISRKTAVIAELRSTARRVNDLLSRGFDSTGFRRELDKVNRLKMVAGDGIFENHGTAQTNRNLEASKIFLSELLADVGERKDNLEDYLKELEGYRSALDSLQSDSALFVIPDDSLDAVDYVRRILVLNLEVGPADSSLAAASKRMQRFLNEVSLLYYSIQNDLKQIADYRQNISVTSSRREFTNIWGPVGYSRPLNEILRFSAKKSLFVLQYYLKAHWGKLLMLIVLVLLLTRFLTSIRQSVLSANPDFNFANDKVVLRFPFLSATFILINVFQFVFPDPPFMFYGSLWVLAGFFLTTILQGYILPFWNRSWITLFFLFVLAYVDNNVLQASRAERWYILCLALAGVITTLIILIRGKRSNLREKRILLFITIMGVLHIVSIVANMYGRYNIAKVMMTAGFFNMAVGVMLLWTIRFINDTLQYSSDTLKRAYNKVFYVDFTKVNQSAPKYVYVLLGVGWFALMARNFYFYSVLMDSFRSFLTDERQIGQFTFTIGSMAIFFVVLLVAGLASKVVSFFASDSYQQQSQMEESNATDWSSWLLILRIAIITSGILLALAAAGIPLDRLTIILGALGVGIGLGLQAIVNNLVSGIIIAFEKPIRVGDVVEIGSQSGIMKSIGFRSSVITTWDGSDVIIPNGDLLNQHLINWTGQTKMRRVEVLVGVAYGTDLSFVQTKLNDMLLADERILKTPAPVVLLVKFNNSSVDFRVLFWVANYATWLAVKSDVILRIDKLFKENNITIPFPQQDIYIKTTGAPATAAKEVESKENNSDDDERLPPMKTPG